MSVTDQSYPGILIVINKKQYIYSKYYWFKTIKNEG